MTAVSKTPLSGLARDALEALTYGPIPVVDLARNLSLSTPGMEVTTRSLGPALAALARRGYASATSELVDRPDGRGRRRIILYALASPDWSIVDAPETLKADLTDSGTCPGAARSVSDSLRASRSAPGQS